MAGGIGAGKSSVAEILRSLGAAVVDSDRLAHEQLNDPQVAATLERWWGPSVFASDGKIDPAAVAGIVFRNPAELQKLEDLLYPRIAVRRDELMAKSEDDPRVRAIVIDAPKLFEAGVDKLCDAVIFVDAEPEVRAARVAASRGWPREEWIRRENLQNPLDKKRTNADHVVENHSSIEELRSKVEKVFSAVLAAFA